MVLSYTSLVSWNVFFSDILAHDDQFLTPSSFDEDLRMQL
jgi:hypothetical protein